MSRSILHRGYVYAWFQYISYYEDGIEPVKGRSINRLARSGEYGFCQTNREIGPQFDFEKPRRMSLEESMRAWDDNAERLWREYEAAHPIG